jgi:hypothetical protein
MQKLMTTDVGNATVVTWSVRPVLQSKPKHPYETYLFLFDEKGYDTCTMCHKTLAEAKKYHEEMVLMFGECHATPC